MTTQNNPLYLELDLTPAECANRFKDFYTNNAIKSLAKWPKWAVSNPVEKAPISMYGLAMTPPIEYFASSSKPRDMWPLHKILISMPNLSNSAMYLNGDECGFAIVDIEKTCPKKLKEKLLSLPWHYAETSLSGKGIHLVIDYPKNLIDKYPNANKAKVQDSNKTYEILLHHWVTFTRNAIDPAKIPQRGTLSIEDCLEDLFSSQRKAITSDLNFNVTDPEKEIPKYTSIFITAKSNITDTHYNEILKRKDNDDSKADFEMARQCAMKVKEAIEQEIDSETAFEDFESSHFAYLTKAVMVKQLNREGIWREKYDSARNDVNYLEMTIANVCAFVLRNYTNNKKGD